MIEYGPKLVTNGLTLCLDAANPRSYIGSGTTWNDLAGLNNTTALTNGPTFSSSNNGIIILDGADDMITIPGSAVLYPSDFTWHLWHKINSNNGANIAGIYWSEDAVKNFLFIYRNSGTGTTYARIDTDATVYTSTSDGTQYLGFGSTAGPITGRWMLTTLIKNGTQFRLYWDSYLLMWDVTITDWSILSSSQAITIGDVAGVGAPISMNIGCALMYNRVLTSDEVIQNYNALKSRYNLT